VAETRQVFDLPQPKLEVTAHQLLKGKCPGCGKWHKGIAPEGVNAPVQYGYGVKTLAVLLNVVLARASIFGVMASVSPLDPSRGFRSSTAINRILGLSPF
jgi:hypothetical protein